MKTYTVILTIALSAFAASAQLTNPPASFFPTNSPATSFIQDVASWATSFNTAPAYNWTNQLWQITEGVATVTGGSVADRLEIDRNIGSFQVGIEGEFLGVGSAFDKVEANAGYSLFQQNDFKLNFEIAGGYDFDAKDQYGKKVGAMVTEPMLAAYKMMTTKTFSFIKYGFPIESVGKFNSVGMVEVGAGFTF